MFSVCDTGSRRASDDADEFEEAGMQKGMVLTQEQREYLRWFYRTEDRKYCYHNTKN